MPLENVSRGFKDVSLSFKVHPITYDVLPLNNESAINRSLRNLILTISGERPFNSLLGTTINRSLFEILDARLTSNIESEIRSVITNFEPRVKLRTINVTPDFVQNGYHVLIDYEVIGSPVPPQQINFILQVR